MDSRAKALLAARAADEKKAKDVVILDIQHLTPLCDYLSLPAAAVDTGKGHCRSCRRKAFGSRFSLDHREGQNDSGRSC